MGDSDDELTEMASSRVSLCSSEEAVNFCTWLWIYPFFLHLLTEASVQRHTEELNDLLANLEMYLSLWCLCNYNHCTDSELSLEGLITDSN